MYWSGAISSQTKRVVGSSGGSTTFQPSVLSRNRAERDASRVPRAIWANRKGVEPRDELGWNYEVARRSILIAIAKDLARESRTRLSFLEFKKITRMDFIQVSVLSNHLIWTINRS